MLCVLIPLSGQEEPAVVSLFVNGEYHGNVEVAVEGERVSIPTGILIRTVAPLIDEEYYESLATIEKTTLNMEELTLLGMDARLDYSDLSLRILLPPRYLRERVLAPPPDTPMIRGIEVHPQRFSAFTNGALRVGVVPEEGAEPGWDAAADIDGAVNMEGWVVESAVTAQITDAENSEVRNLRLVRDLPEQGFRISLGTVDLPSTRLSGRMDAYGITMVPLLSSEKRDAIPEFDTIVVENNARIDVIVNGILVRSEHVAPGKYRLGDIPLASGLNEVVLRIEEEGRAPLERKVGLSHESTILPLGASRFSLGLGSLSRVEPSPLGAITFDYGLGTESEIAAGLQAGIAAVSASIGLRGATPIGFLSFEGAVSWAAVSPGYSAVALYRLGFPGKPFIPRLGFGAEYASRTYVSPASVDSERPAGDVWRISAQATQATPIGISLALAADYGSSDGENTAFGVALGTTVGLGKGAGLTISASLDDRQGPVLPSLSLSLLVIPDGGKTVSKFGQSITGGESGADFSWNGGNRPGDYAVGFGIENPIGPQSLPVAAAGSIQRRGRYSDASLSGRYRYDRVPDTASYGAYFGIDGALAYADGLWAPSRRISDSFALLQPAKDFGTETVELRTGPSSKAVATGGKTDSLSGLSSYGIITAYVDAPDAPPDITPKDPVLALRPTYKSGLAVRPVKNISVYGAGTIVDSEGKAVAWAVGSIYRSDGERVDDFFTDENGRFEIYGMEPGAYILEFERLGMRIPVEIPPGSDGLVEFGSLGGQNQ